MATPPDHDPMALIERELVALRRNVEHELVTGLREKIHAIILEAFVEVAADPDLVSAAKKQGRSHQDAFAITNLRMAASTDDPGDCRVQTPDLARPQSPSEVSVAATESSNMRDFMQGAPQPWPSELPHCVVDTSQANQLYLPDTPTKKGKSDESNLQEDVSPGNLVVASTSEGTSPRSEIGKVPSSRLTATAEALRSSVFASNDEAILQRTGCLWAVDPRTHRLARLVRTDWFDYAMGAVLVCNSIVIGLRVDWEANNLGAASLPVYVWADRAFCVAFLTELGLRLYTFRLTFYLISGWQWAYFDTVVVAFQVLEEAVLIAAGDSAMNLGFLKMLKMGRLMRMVRMIRLLPELKSLVLLIMVSISSFMWTCFLLMLLVYMLAVYMVMMTVDSLEKTMGQDSVSRRELQLYWGSVGSAALSCFWSITGGQDWAVVITPLVDETGTQVHNVVFAMFVAFATMVLMNLVTGVFVEGAQRLTKEDRDKDLSKMAHKVFRAVDDDGSSEISKEEFNRHIKDGKLDGYLAAVDLDVTAADNLFELLDRDHTDSIDVIEFIEGCLRLRGPPRSADVAQLLLETRKTAIDQKNQFGTIHHLVGRLQTEVKQLRNEMRSD